MSIELSDLRELCDESALEQLLEYIGEGHFCALLGPPRSGKSSTLREAHATLHADENSSAIYIDLRKYQFLNTESSPDQALSSFFFQLIRDIASEIGLEDPELTTDKDAGGTGFVRSIGTFASSGQSQIILFLDHFESLSPRWGHALLGTLRAVYDQRLPSSPYFRQVTVVIASSVNIFEISLGGKTSPLSIARMVTTSDLTRQQVDRFLDTVLTRHNLTVPERDLDKFYDATLGNRSLMITLCRLWIDEANDQEVVCPFETLRERFLSRMHLDYRLNLIISQIEENTDVLIQVLDLLRGAPVKRRAFRTGLSDLELVGVARPLAGGFAIHNPLFQVILEHHFTPERVVYLLDKADQPLIVLQYLHDLLGNGPLGSYRELYLKVISDVIARDPDDVSADAYLLEGVSRAFDFSEAQMCHVSDEQVLFCPEHPEPSLDEISLIKSALAQAQAVPGDVDPVTIAVPLTPDTHTSGDALLLRNFCKREDLFRERARLAVIKRFSQEALQNRVRWARSKKYRYLQEASTNISDCLEEEFLLHRTAQSVCEVLACDFATIYLYDSGRGRFEEGFAHNLHNPIGVSRAPRRKGISARIIETGHPLTITPSKLDPTRKIQGRTLSPRTLKFLEEEEANVVRGYPIQLGDNRIGVIYLGYRAPHFFRPLEEEAISTLLNQAAALISRGYLSQAIRRIAEALGGSEYESPEDQIRTLLESATLEVCRLLGVPQAHAWRVRQLEGQGYELYNGVKSDQGKYVALDPVLIDSLPEAEWDLEKPVVFSSSDSGSTVYNFLQLVGLKKSPVAVIGFTHSPRQRVPVLIVAADPYRNRTFTQWDVSMLRALITQVAAEAENAYLFAKSRERLQRLETILDFSEQYGKLDKESDLLRQVIDFAVQTIPAADAGSIHRLDETRQWLEVGAHSGYEDDDDISKLRAVRLRVGQGFAGQAVRDRTNLNIKDFDAELADNRLPNPLGIQSALVIPMIVKNDPIGTINVDSRSVKAAFGVSDEQWLETLANQTAIAIDRIRLIERLEKELHTLSETIGLSPENITVTELTSESLMKIPDEIFQSILEKAINMISANMGNIRLCDWKEKVLVNRACFPEDASIDDSKVKIGLTDGIIGRVITKGEAVLVEDVHDNPEFVPFFRKEVRSELAVPLKVGTQVIGVINLESTMERAFNRRDREALERLAAAVSYSLARMALHRKASELQEQGILQKSRRALLKLDISPDMRVTCELKPSSLGLGHSTNPIAFDELGIADTDDLRHEIERLCDYIQMAYRLGEGHLREEWLRWAKRIGVGFMEALQKENRSIADAFLGAQLMGLRPESVLIRVITSRDHLFLPVELLYLEHWPWVIRYPLVRTITEVKSIFQNPFEHFVDRKVKQRIPINILLIGADVRKGISATTEIKTIRDELNRAQNDMGILLNVRDCSGSEVSIDNVKTLLKDGEYHIIHIASEGFVDQRPDNSGIVLPSRSGAENYGVLRVREMAPLLAGARPRFVYLSLCRGAQVSEGSALRSGSTLGILDALVQVGIPAVLGYRWDVTDQGARHFAQRFYSHLFKERSLELATFYARRQMYHTQDLNETWISPILVNQMVHEKFWTAEV